MSTLPPDEDSLDWLDEPDQQPEPLDFAAMDTSELEVQSTEKPEQQQKFSAEAKARAEWKRQHDLYLITNPPPPTMEAQVILKRRSTVVVDPSYWQLQLSALRRALASPDDAKLSWTQLLKTTEASYPYRVPMPNNLYLNLSQANRKRFKPELKQAGLKYRADYKSPTKLLEAIRTHHDRQELSNYRETAFTLDPETGALYVSGTKHMPDSRGRYRLRHEGLRLELSSTQLTTTVQFAEAATKLAQGDSA